VRSRERNREKEREREREREREKILPHAIDFRALCGANLITSPSDIRGNEILEIHRVVQEVLEALGPTVPPESRKKRIIEAVL
jgi:hypothetical protein